MYQVGLVFGSRVKSLVENQETMHRLLHKPEVQARRSLPLIGQQFVCHNCKQTAAQLLH